MIFEIKCKVKPSNTLQRVREYYKFVEP